MGPKSAIKVASTATVATVFASNATARLPPASRSAMIPEPITVAAKSIEPRPSAKSLRRTTSDRLGSEIAFPNGTQRRLQRHAIKRVDLQTRKESYSSFKLFECLAEGKRLLGVSTFNRRGVFDSPVRCHRLAGPDGTHFAGGVVAHGKNKIDWRRSGRRELVPALAAKAFGPQIHALEEIERQPMHLTLWEASCTEGAELALAPMI